MITLHKIQVDLGDRRGALAAARYALEPSEGPEAYAREGEDPSAPQWGGTVWLGTEEALEQLGLKRGAAVELEQLTAALQGRHVQSGKQVRKPGPAKVRDADGEVVLDEQGKELTKQVINSYDLTFSVPKSVSVLWSQADARLRYEIEQAIMDAANTALEHVVRTRLVVGGEEVAKGFAASASLHVVARTADGDPAPAPQLHVHMRLVGVIGESGRLRTPDGAALYKDSAMREAGALARGVLAARMEKLGFAIKARTGREGRYFELAGVPAELCERLSGRSRDVLAWVQGVKDRLGIHLDNRAAARGAAATRRQKSGIPQTEAQSWWRALAQEHGFDRLAIAAMRGPLPKRDLAAIQEQIRERVLERLWAEGPTVHLGVLQSLAYEDLPLGVRPSQANAVLERMRAKGELVMLEEGLVTSAEIRRAEERVREVALAAARRGRPALGSEALARGIAAAEASLGGHRLDPEQLRAVQTLTSGTDWATLVGRPGTGKGPVLEAVAEAHRAAGWKVLATSLDGATAVRLGKQVNGKAMSFQMLAHRLAHGMQIDDRTLLVVDEASKAGLKEWLILAEAFAKGGRVIAVGDVKQTGAIESPGMFDLIVALKDLIPRAKLRVVRRHRDPNDPSKPHPWMARAAASEAAVQGKEQVRPGYHDALYAGDVEEAIAVLQEEGALHLYDTREESMVGLVEKWHQRRGEYNLDVRDTVLVIYGSNEDVDRVNALAQAKRLETGEIGGPSVAAVDRSYRIYAGDVVMLRETAFQPQAGPGQGRVERIENGTMGTVVAVDPVRELVRVAFDAPEGTREVEMDLGALRAEFEAQRERKERGEEPARVPSLRLSIAGHVFPLQGGTWWYAASLWGDGLQRLEDTISGDSRAQCMFEAHADRESLGSEGSDAERLARKAEQMKEIRHKLSSLLHEKDPELRTRAPVSDLSPAPILDPSQKTDLERAAAGREWRDPLRHHRRVLGPERVAQVQRRAGELEQDAKALSEPQLRAAAARAEEAIVRLDPHAAHQTLRLERDEVLLATKVAEARDLATELQAQAEALGRSPAKRRQRRQLLQEAEARLAEAERYEGKLARVRAQERALHADGRHLDDWLAAEGEALALAAAAERELAARGRAPAQPETQERAEQPEQPELAPAGPDAGLEAGL